MISPLDTFPSPFSSISSIISLASGPDPRSVIKPPAKSALPSAAVVPVPKLGEVPVPKSAPVVYLNVTGVTSYGASTARAMAVAKALNEIVIL